MLTAVDNLELEVTEAGVAEWISRKIESRRREIKREKEGLSR